MLLSSVDLCVSLMFLELLAFYLTTGWSTSVCPTTPTSKGFPSSRCCCEWSRLQGKGREERRWQISRFLISTTTHHISRTLLSPGHHHHHHLLLHRLLLLLLLLSLLVAIIILNYDFGFLFLWWSCIEEEIIELLHLFRSDQEYQPITHTSTHTYKHRERARARERERDTHTHTHTSFSSNIKMWRRGGRVCLLVILFSSSFFVNRDLLGTLDWSSPEVISRVEEFF